ncbi:MAG: ABC transporter ATP-binding protein [Candidatus Magasanikbacteria bacterium]|nr:ABC transporter ATP-binding protein [Candidatus Magasanikbacteria bacterium]
MITTRAITKTYTDEDIITNALRSITLSIEQGEFVAIMGPSGSGKSTLLQMLSFLDRPTTGIIEFQGKQITDLSDSELAELRNRTIGFVFQSFNLLARQTVYANVELPLIYGDLKPELRAARIHNAIEAVGLSEKTKIHAGKLSGGQKQRVAIARALVTDPSVIFADEPTGNLDSVSGTQVMEILTDLHKHGKTIILVTHDLKTAHYANRLITFKDGMIESDKKL